MILDISAYGSLLAAGYETDDFAKQLTKNISMGSVEGAMLSNGLLYVGCHLLIAQDLKVRKLLYNLAHDTLGHFGFYKSYESFCGSYYWPHMRCDLEMAYIPSCAECQQNKHRTTKPTGLLHPLPVPDDCLDTVALDFIGPLPEEDGKDMILTMTDLLRADIRLAGTHCCTSCHSLI
jgi:Integrase zinc binding domain